MQDSYMMAIMLTQTHMGSPSRIVCTMYLIAYPFLSMGASTSMAAIGVSPIHMCNQNTDNSSGLLVAAWSSQDGLVVKGAIWLLLFPATCLPVWYWTQRSFPMTQASRTASTDSMQSTVSPPAHQATPGTSQAQPSSLRQRGEAVTPPV